MDDIYLTDAGDIEVGPNGDLKLVRGNDELVQGIRFRCMTVAGDFLLQPACGASLEDLLGEPNTRETGALMETLIINALTHDGFISPDILSVTAFPISLSTISALIVVTTTEAPIRVSTTIDLVEGEVQFARA
jgi:hypothetical protein